MVHLIAPAPAGGAESVVLALTAADPAHTRAIILNQVAPHDAPPHPMAAALARANVTVREIRAGRRRYRAEVGQCAELLRAMGARLVHTHGYHADVVGWFAARRLGIPVVATVHGYLSRNLKERAFNVIDRRMLRGFNAVIAVSDQIREQLVRSGIAAPRVHRVQNGMPPAALRATRDDARRRLGLPTDGLVVGWVGRLSPEKGADLFLRALAATPTVGRAVIVGEGQDQERLMRLAADLGLGQDRLVFAGFRPDAAELLAAFDVLALTSRREGTPMIILEAAAAGLPIVAFATGGIPQLLDDECAWLVPPADVSALGAALRDALGSPEERRVRAERALEALTARLGLEGWLGQVREAYAAAERNRAGGS